MKSNTRHIPLRSLSYEEGMPKQENIVLRDQGYGTEEMGRCAFTLSFILHPSALYIVPLLFKSCVKRAQSHCSGGWIFDRLFSPTPASTSQRSHPGRCYALSYPGRLLYMLFQQLNQPLPTSTSTPGHSCSLSVLSIRPVKLFLMTGATCQAQPGKVIN